MEIRACCQQSGESILRVFSALAVLLCSAVSGCAELGVTGSVQQPRVEPAPPDEKKLAELVAGAFKAAKLSGAPEVSPLHAIHDGQMGDWMVCIKSSATDQPLKYAVLIGNNSVLEVRSLVSIDRCDNETYRLIKIANVQAAPIDAHAAAPPTPPRPRRGH
jgi:hypothetical protein